MAIESVIQTLTICNYCLSFSKLTDTDTDTDNGTDQVTDTVIVFHHRIYLTWLDSHIPYPHPRSTSPSLYPDSHRSYPDPRSMSRLPHLTWNDREEKGGYALSSPCLYLHPSCTSVLSSIHTSVNSNYRPHLIILCRISVSHQIKSSYYAISCLPLYTLT